MAICSDCANRSYCTFPRTETTSFCDEYEDSVCGSDAVQLDLKTVLEQWGFVMPERS